MATTLPSIPLSQPSFSFPSQNPYKPLNPPTFFFSINGRPPLIRCSAKKKISFFDQILDYIEGGPKLRKWYGAPELIPKKNPNAEDEDGFLDEDGVRDTILVTDGDSEIGQMVILSLIVKRAKIKAFVKDRRKAMEAFGTYVESIAGDTTDKLLLKKALRGVRAIICPSDGFLSNVGSLKGVNHVILLSQLSVYRGSGGIEALMKSNARKLAEQDESVLMAAGVPYTIIRVGMLENTPGGTQGFNFDKGGAEKGSLSKEDAAFICVEALDIVPQGGFTFEVVNGEEKISNWKDHLAGLMEKAQQ